MYMKLVLSLQCSLVESLAILMLCAQFATGNQVSYQNLEPPQPDWPECPQEPSNCIDIGPKDNEFTRKYEVDGRTITFSFPDTPFSLNIVCNDNVTLDSSSMPRFNKGTKIHSLQLERCSVPTSYRRFLEALNTTSVTRLRLIFETILLQNPLPKDLWLSDLGLDQLGAKLVFLKDGELEAIQKINSIDIVIVTLPTLLSSELFFNIYLSGEEARLNLGGSNELEYLDMVNWRLNNNEFPIKWVSHGSKLRYVSLKNVTIKELPSDVLWNAYELDTFILSDVTISEIPAKLFMNTKKLENLHITNNHLKHLPWGMLSSLPALKVLKLDSNPIGDLCNGTNSALGNILLLKNISLKNTGATRICSEWEKILPSLLDINLSANNIRELKFRDINWLRRKNTRLDISSNPVETIYYTEEDYKILNKTAMTNHEYGYNPQKILHLTLDSALSCDCRSYWFARAIQDYPNHIFLTLKLKCQSNEKFFNQNLSIHGDNATCRLPRKECSSNCECLKRVNFDAVEANCAGAALRQLPTINHLEKMNAADNKIESIGGLPETLKFLNLENNQISHLDEEAITTLFASGRRLLRLAGNPLLCRCEDLPLIHALKTNQEQVIDYVNLTCVNKGPISAIIISDMCKLHRTTVTASSIVGSIVAIAIFIGIVFYKYKREIKVYIFNKGWCMRWICEEDLDCGKKYDAFVSYSHLDEEFVITQIISELESEEYGFRLCVHYRDWIVGEWIPAQIAFSVDQSRRTIIVLSRNFLKSEWARLEFRTAHISAMKEGRARIVIVLLESFNDLQDGLDDELRTFLATNTYVQWGDPQFHAKLRYALPYRREELKARKLGRNVISEELLYDREDTSL